jgi:hypothetical protein
MHGWHGWFRAWPSVFWRWGRGAGTICSGSRRRSRPAACDRSCASGTWATTFYPARAGELLRAYALRKRQTRPGSGELAWHVSPGFKMGNFFMVRIGQADATSLRSLSHSAGSVRVQSGLPPWPGVGAWNSAPSRRWLDCSRPHFIASGALECEAPVLAHRQGFVRTE